MSVCLSVILSVILSVCLSFCLSVCLSFCLSVCLSVILSVCLSVCLSIYLSIYLSIHLPVYPSIYLSVYLSIYLSLSCTLGVPLDDDISNLPSTRAGSMSTSLVSLLTIYFPPLLPLGAADMEISHTMQAAAMMGVGLLYLGSGNRHMVQVMLREIGHPPGPELEFAEDRESYALSAGLALGLITLGVCYMHASPVRISCSELHPSSPFFYSLLLSLPSLPSHCSW